jgi:transcription elongation factor GreA
MITAARAPIGAWPMTADAWSALTAEIERLEADTRLDRSVPGFGDPDRRRRTLHAVRDGGSVVDAPDVVAIGRAVVLERTPGVTERYRIVLPGDGALGEGWISADSPVGWAVLGRRVGERATVDAPAGRWTALIVAVE